MADVIIVGGGLAGLACALELRAQGVEPLILEASDQVGGRVRTDRVEGFRLDRGFQVVQTWYPEARRVLDYPALDLRPFEPGALVRWEGRLHRVSDVWRRPWRAGEMLTSGVGTLADKLRLVRLRRRALAGDLHRLYARPETDALGRLRAMGFSARIIERFFKPFFAGVFFEPELAVSSHAFDFVFRAFALGDAALPALGMGAIPAQLAARLPQGSIRLNAPVAEIGDGWARLGGGERIEGAALVIATDAPAAARLLGWPAPATRGTTCFYFAAERPPVAGPYLVLNGESGGLINSLLCPSSLSEHYAPPGRHLIAVNVLGAGAQPEALEANLRQELGGWFGPEVQRWRRLAVYQLPEALPVQAPPVPDPAERNPKLGGRIYLCGELDGAPSFHWALDSGRRAASAVACDLAVAGRPAPVTPAAR